MTRIESDEKRARRDFLTNQREVASSRGLGALFGQVNVAGVCGIKTDCTTASGT